MAVPPALTVSGACLAGPTMRAARLKPDGMHTLTIAAVELIERLDPAGPLGRPVHGRPRRPTDGRYEDPAKALRFGPASSPVWRAVRGVAAECPGAARTHPRGTQGWAVDTGGGTGAQR